MSKINEYADLHTFIKDNCGGVANLASKIGLTPRSVYKWIEKKSLPRTEFSEETRYSKTLSELSGFTETEIKNRFKPTSKPLNKS